MGPFLNGTVLDIAKLIVFLLNLNSASPSSFAPSASSGGAASEAAPAQEEAAEEPEEEAGGFEGLGSLFG